MSTRYRTYPIEDSPLYWVESIWIQHCDQRGPHPVTTILPSGRVELIFQYADPFVQCGRNPSVRLPDAHAVGQQSQAMRVQAMGCTGMVIVRLLPWAAGAVLGPMATAIANELVDLSDIWPEAHLDEFIDSLKHAQTDAMRYKLTVQFLSEIPLNSEVDPLCERATVLMNESWGRYRIGDLAKDLGYSRRQFSRRYSIACGASPKQVLNRLRMRKSVACLQAGMEIQEIVARCGYSDQSHLIHDLSRRCGKKPSDILNAAPSRLKAHYNSCDLAAYQGAVYL